MQGTQLVPVFLRGQRHRITQTNENNAGGLVEIDQKRIDDLVLNPAEGLNVEVKRWIDPTTPEGQAKVVKAALALRNRNGGYFVVGFDDATLQPDVGNSPPDPRAVWHLDDIQGLVSRKRCLGPTFFDEVR